MAGHIISKSEWAAFLKLTEEYEKYELIQEIKEPKLYILDSARDAITQFKKYAVRCICSKANKKMASAPFQFVINHTSGNLACPFCGNEFKKHGEKFRRVFRRVMF